MSRTARFALAGLTLVAAAVVTASAPGAKGGPSPGVAVGWNGVLARDGATRYVALPAGVSTAVAVVRVRGGKVVRFSSVKGVFGVPLVAYDGSTAGLSHDGRTLVLGSFTPRPESAADTRFAVLAATSLRTQKLITLPGSWSFDALSPDGKKLYLVEYLAGAEGAGYRVRAYDVERGRLLAKHVIDPNVPAGAMSGEPVTRAYGSGGAWAYTLYNKPGGGLPFIHALDTIRGKAICIELPWRDAEAALGNVRMSVASGGRTLVLRQRGARLAAVDTRSFVVRAFKRPS
jgi:hypothetical protein